MNKPCTLLTFVLSGLTGISLISCGIARPLHLDPPESKDSAMRLTVTSLSALAGDYEILTDDAAMYSLDYMVTHKNRFDREKRPGKGDYVNLAVTGDNRIKATLFLNNKEKKTSLFKGGFKDGYFRFHNSKLSFRTVFLVHSKQTALLSLTKEGDLLLDTNRGGIGFFLILPIPLSGSSYDMYNLRFRRIQKSG